MGAFRVRVGDREVTCVRAVGPDALPATLAEAGLPGSRPVVVLVGGAGALVMSEIQRLAPVFTAGLAAAIEQAGAVAVDGGTDAGVMRLLGEARARNSATFPLVGVVAEGTVRIPGSGPAKEDAADLEPHHTHFVLVPGDDWGDEASWISLTATCIAASAPSVTVLVNGGDIAYADATFSLEAGRPVLVIAGSGRAANEIAAAVRSEPCDPRAEQVALSELVSCVEADSPTRVREAIIAALGLPSS